VEQGDKGGKDNSHPLHFLRERGGKGRGKHLSRLQKKKKENSTQSEGVLKVEPPLLNSGALVEKKGKKDARDW